MEYLLVAVIAYFILRTARNLVGLVSGTEVGSKGVESSGDAESIDVQWEGPSPREETGAERGEPTFWGEDIEDATWHDVESSSRVY